MMAPETTGDSTSLYRCSVCGHVIRADPGHESLGHVHYDEDGKYLGKGAEGYYVEFEDDDRDVEDIRKGEGRWMA